MRSRPTMVSRFPARGRLARWKPLLIAVAFILLSSLFIGGSDGFYRLWQRRQEWRKLEEAAAILEAENDSLKQILWRLENDLEYVEKVAREEYGMSKQGERVYRIHPPEKGEAQESE